MRDFKVGDLVKIKSEPTPASTWMQEAQVKEVPLLIIAQRRQEDMSELAEAYRDQYQILYNGRPMWIYKKILEEITHE